VVAFPGSAACIVIPADTGRGSLAIAVIPARYASTRLPGKPLVALAGKPMIERVWERVRRAEKISRVIVATDDERIMRAVAGFGGEAVMTRAEHRSGTERVAEVAATAVREGDEIFVNVQGDEPLIEPGAIDAVVEAIESEEGVTLATLAVPIVRPADIMDPNVVKVVLDFDGNALYFSRAPIPWVRDREAPVHARHLKHLGLYAFRRDALLDFPTLPLGDLERIEQLEQLRWMENGYKIRVAETVHDSVSVDVPADVARVEQLLRESPSA
jgi:3-deoxy-manno-octulosonate cytidylyltransferase (CMP-KDO synthetase)